ncbi:ABC transporter substrate-binding protein [Paenibacillus methanolicus]|uniref:Multiple sugar transport system substrate-binding protein n=1 Tax=Paenibacillus methanolicus TaxID=582686 RepID=A0A5S5C495_9BACL|nr:extracellular solute-binding protein [Paenibacillus methanolicus]TYP73150.1 multiple sugar transport system substrate-binding protein [Paenibacillus methanolicus]
MRLSKGVLTSLMFVSAILVQGCSGDDSFNPEEPEKLKVMYFDEDTFNQKYGQLIYSKFPNLEIEIVATQPIFTDSVVNMEQAYRDVVEKENPDVILMNTLTQYSELIEKNKLMDMEPMLLEEDFKSADLLPASLQLLREQGGGKLYGIAPFFSTKVLYYNKDLFDQYKVPLPTKSMTWPEVIELAQRFPTTGSEEDRVYGFAMHVLLSDLGSAIGETLGLRLTDSAGKKVTVQSEGWKQVYKMAVDAQKSGAFYFPGTPKSTQSIEESLNRDKFIIGKAAMGIEDFYLANRMKMNATRVKKFNWGWLTEPYDPANPDVSSSFYLTEIYGVNADSANKEAAWQLVKYMNGDETAKLLSRSHYGSLMTRTQYNQSDEGFNFDSFYSLQPPRGPEFFKYNLFNFARSLRELTDQELKAVAKGSKSLDEAITTIQNEGQLELDMANKRMAEADK